MGQVPPPNLRNRKNASIRTAEILDNRTKDDATAAKRHS